MSWSEIEGVLITYNWLVECYTLEMTVGEKIKCLKVYFVFLTGENPHLSFFYVI